MKILQLVQKPQRRGAEIFARQLSHQLRRDGHDVATAYLYAPADATALPLEPHDRLLGGRERHVCETIPGVHPGLLRRLQRCIDELQPDIVQANGGRTVKYGAAAALSNRGRGWALIYRNIGQPSYWTSSWRQRAYARLIMPRLDGIVGVSAATLDTVKSLYAVAVPTMQIPCAVDPAAVVPSRSREQVRRQTGTPPDAPVIVWAGSLTDEKRVDRLLRAATAVKRLVPALYLWIVGDGPLRRGLERTVRASTLSSQVCFTGAQDCVADYMNAGDVVALTSDTEGMPAVLLEAGLLGKPVVATRVGGIAECVLDEQTGLLVQRNDEHALAGALLGLVQQPERRRRLGQAASEFVEQNFTMPRVARKYVAFYQQVLAG